MYYWKKYLEGSNKEYLEEIEKKKKKLINKYFQSMVKLLTLPGDVWVN